MLEQSEKSYGIVLAGGGAKGAYQIGALKALREMGILDRIHSVSGVSIGSVNMTFLASNSLEKAEKAWKNIEVMDFIELDGNGFDILKEGDGIFTREGLKKILHNNINLDDISKAPIDYYLNVCTKTADSSIVPLYVKLNGKDSDTIMNYIMASSAIPIVYDNVCVEGRMCFDGGLKDNTPIKPLYEAGASDIIVISNDSNYKVEGNWTNAKIYPIVPSHSLELDAVIGTGDLSRANAHYRLMLGYLDTKAIMGAFIKGSAVPNLAGNHNIALQEQKKVTLCQSVNNNMEGLARILGSNDFLN